MEFNGPLFTSILDPILDESFFFLSRVKKCVKTDGRQKRKKQNKNRSRPGVTFVIAVDRFTSLKCLEHHFDSRPQKSVFI